MSSLRLGSLLHSSAQGISTLLTPFYLILSFRVTSDWIVERLTSLHLKPKISPVAPVSSASLFSGDVHLNETMYMVELVVDAPRASGAEAVVLTSRFERLSASSPKPSASASYSWAFLASFVQMVQHQRWRSKDIVVVLTPAPAGTRAAEQWIERLSDARSDSTSLQYRHSVIIAALTIDLPPVTRFRALAIKPESLLGTLPNLDLPNTIFRVAYLNGIHYLSWTPSNWITWHALPSWLKGLEHTPLFSQWVNPSRTDEMNTLLSFMRNMAFGEPTGDHSVISKYKIEAVTISAQEPGTGKGNVPRMGDVLEGTLRSINNLIEPLHQSFYYYFPLTPFTFVPIGHYMISWGLLFAPATLFTLLTIIPASSEHLAAAGATLVRTLPAGIIAFLLPYAMPIMMPHLTPLLAEIGGLGDQVHVPGEIYQILLATTCALVLIPAISAYRTSKQKFTSAAPSALAKTERADVIGAIAIAPYLFFLAASVLINASFAMVAIIPTLPLVTLALFKRTIPRFIRLPISLLSNPLLWAIALPRLIDTNTSLTALVIANWQNFYGLTFPFACLLLPVSLVSLVLAIVESD